MARALEILDPRLGDVKRPHPNAARRDARGDRPGRRASDGGGRRRPAASERFSDYSEDRTVTRIADRRAHRKI
jgi:hypothetical protein